jgi:hypothetical protein
LRGKKTYDYKFQRYVLIINLNPHSLLLLENGVLKRCVEDAEGPRHYPLVDLATQMSVHNGGNLKIR